MSEAAKPAGELVPLSADARVAAALAAQRSPWAPPPLHRTSVARESSETGQIAAALVSALSRMRNPPRNRSVEVSTRGGGKYSFRYATLDKILDMARPALAAEGLALFQPLTANEKGELVLVTRLLHRSGEWMETAIPLPKPNPAAPQEFGSAVTYIRRYAVTAQLGIASDEDDDANRAAGNHMKDITPRHERLRDESSRATDPVDLIRLKAKIATDTPTVPNGTALLGAWNSNRAAIEEKRGTPQWEALAKQVVGGLAKSLGRVPATLFAAAAKLEDEAGIDGFLSLWGRDCAITLAEIQEMESKTYAALRDHAAASITRVNPVAAAVLDAKPPAGRKPGREASA